MLHISTKNMLQRFTLTCGCVQRFSVFKACLPRVRSVRVFSKVALTVLLFAVQTLESRPVNAQEPPQDSFIDQQAPQASTQVGPVTAPPADLELAPFYAKYISANGYPIVGSAKVDDYALKEAAYLVNLMLAKRPDIKQAMVKSGSRLIVMDYQEMTTQIPEHSMLRPIDYWDRRARGLGGSRTDPVCSCAEENLLCYPGDPYPTENILIHEFAHNIHLRGLVNVDPSFDDRLKQTYDDAMLAGLWKTKYAATNKNEYWAEGVQSWFNNNRPPDSSHNHVDTREELKDYDPGLASLCEEVFGDTKLVYTKPSSRLSGHLRGFDPAISPTFEWQKSRDK